MIKEDPGNTPVSPGGVSIVGVASNMYGTTAAAVSPGSVGTADVACNMYGSTTSVSPGSVGAVDSTPNLYGVATPAGVYSLVDYQTRSKCYT